jgi:hypothetical protein
MTAERRFINQPLSVSKREDSDGLTITGYGAVFYRDGAPDTEFPLHEDFVERIAPGAFDATAREDDIRGLFNHDADNILGRSAAGTMRLSVDEIGLRYDIDLPDTDIGLRVARAIERGDVTGSSFSFSVRKAEMQDGGGGVTVRSLQDVSVLDVGPVTFPAYKGTSAVIRSEDKVGAMEELKQWKDSQADGLRRQRERDISTVKADMVVRGLTF